MFCSMQLLLCMSSKKTKKKKTARLRLLKSERVLKDTSLDISRWQAKLSSKIFLDIEAPHYFCASLKQIYQDFQFSSCF